MFTGEQLKTIAHVGCFPALTVLQIACIPCCLAGWILLYIFAIPFFYTWTSIVVFACVICFFTALDSFGFVCLLQYENMSCGITLVVRAICFAACIIPAAILVSYGYAGTKYYSGLKIAENINVDETLDYSKHGYTGFTWTNAALYTQYYGYTVLQTNDKYYSFAAPIASATYIANITSSTISVIAVASITTRYLIPIVDEQLVRDRIFPLFQNAGDSGNISPSDRLFYLSALSEIRRKFPFLNIPNDVLFVRLNVPERANSFSMGLYIAGWVLMGFSIVTFCLISSGGAILGLVFRSGSDTD